MRVVVTKGKAMKQQLQENLMELGIDAIAAAPAEDVKRLVKCVSKDDSRKVLTGVLIADGQCVATDGRVLAIRKSEYTFATETDVIIDPKQLKNVKLGKNDLLVIDTNGHGYAIGKSHNGEYNKLSFAYAIDVRVSCDYMNAYPDYTKVMPELTDCGTEYNSLLIDPARLAQLMTALDRPCSKLKMHYTHKNGPLVFTSEELYGIIMPLRT